MVCCLMSTLKFKWNADDARYLDNFPVDIQRTPSSPSISVRKSLDREGSKRLPDLAVWLSAYELTRAIGDLSDSQNDSTRAFSLAPELSSIRNHLNLFDTIKCNRLAR